MSGSKKEILATWLDVVAERFGGSVHFCNGGHEIAVDSEEWRERDLPMSPVFVATEPSTPEQWLTRLRLVEHMSAKALLASPYCFSARIQERGGRHVKQELLDVVRCAFSLGAVTGPLRLQRGTAYHIEPWDLTAVVFGHDRLFDGVQLNEESLTLTNSLEGRLDRLTQLLNRLHEDFTKSESVASMRNELESRLGLELLELDMFYFHREGGASLKGLKRDIPSLDRAIEAEYRGRLKDLYRRYTLAVKLSVLSLGRISCGGQILRERGKQTYRLPFIELGGDDVIRIG